MGRIDDQTVGRILDAADIVEVVGDYVDLRRRGANYMGLCPFHNERTPSFSVSRSKGICKCFSCGKGGSAVNFLMEIEQISYGEALRRLAKKYGIEIKESEMTDDERRRRQHRESLFAMMEFAQGYFAEQLASQPEVVDFLERNGVDTSTAKRFGFGAFGGDSLPLRRAAEQAGYSPDIIEAASLHLIPAEFPAAGALVAPVGNHYGKTVGFRLYATDGSGHCDVGPEMLYRPADSLFGYHQARQSMARTRTVHLVESPIEAAVLSSAGVENCVAPLEWGGMTEPTVALLKKSVENIVVVVPRPLKWRGYEAMRHTLPLMREGLGVKVVTFPGKESFLAFAAGHTSPEIACYIDSAATDMVMFKLDNLQSVASNPGLRQFESVLSADFYVTLGSVGDSISREIYIDETSKRLKLKPSAIERSIKAAFTPNS